MPWTGPEFKKKHNHKLDSKQAGKAAKIASAMIKKGVKEGVAIATANKRAKGPQRKSSGSRSYG